MCRADFRWGLGTALIACVLVQSSAHAADRQLRGFLVRQAESDTVVALLKQVFDQQDVDLKSNARTNMIIVRADAEKMQKIQQIIGRLDQLAFRQAGHVRGIARRGRARIVRRKILVQPDVRVLDDGSIEVRAPSETNYWVRGIAAHKDTKVAKNAPLLLLDTTDREAKTQLEEEVRSLRGHLLESEALARKHRHKRTDFDKKTFAAAAKRSAAIRAGIAQKSRELHKLTSIDKMYAVTAGIDGTVTFIQTAEEYCPGGQPLKPGQLLVRITPQ